MQQVAGNVLRNCVSKAICSTNIAGMAVPQLRITAKVGEESKGVATIPLADVSLFEHGDYDENGGGVDIPMSLMNGESLRVSNRQFGKRVLGLIANAADIAVHNVSASKSDADLKSSIRLALLVVARGGLFGKVFVRFMYVATADREDKVCRKKAKRMMNEANEARKVR